MDNYAQKAVNAIRGLPDQADGVVLWEVPVADFTAWRAMPDTPTLQSHGDYLAALAAIQADVERAGKNVRRVRLPVADVIAALEKNNWPNDTKHRAKVIGLLGAAQ